MTADKAQEVAQRWRGTRHDQNEAAPSAFVFTPARAL